MTRSIIAIWVAGLASLMACDPNGATDSNVEGVKSGACSSGVIGDYNSVATGCRPIFGECPSECSKLVSQFVTKYPGVSCKASIRDGLNEQQITVTKARVESLRCN